MRRVLHAIAAAALLAAPLAGCVTPPAGPASQAATPAQVAQRAMLAAETAFNVAATAELDAKATGLLVGDKADEGDRMRKQAYQVLLTLRATYAAGRTPDLASLIVLTNQLLLLAGKPPATQPIPTIPTL